MLPAFVSPSLVLPVLAGITRRAEDALEAELAAVNIEEVAAEVAGRG